MSSTATKIINCAELLFAEQGFSETSIRQITSSAEVNLAAINYHFGSKKNLIQAVFERYLDYFFDRYFSAIDALPEDPSQRQALVTIVTVVVGPDADMTKAQRFMTLLRHAYTQRQGHVRKFIRDNYHEEYARMFGHLAGDAKLKMGEIEFFWRMQFLLGASMFALAEFDTLKDIAESEYDRTINASTAIELFVPTAIQMLKIEPE